MTQRNPVGWFEIPVKDMPRAKAFYEHVFQVKLQEQPMGELLMAWFPMAPDSPGCGGSLVKSQHYEPSNKGTLIYFSTADIPATLKRSTEKGGKTCLEKHAIGEYGFIGIFTDTEGNNIGLHSMKG